MANKRKSIFEKATRLIPKRRSNGKEAWHEAAERRDHERWQEMHKFLREWAHDLPRQGKKTTIPDKAALYDFITSELSEFSDVIPATSTFANYMRSLEKQNVT